MAYIPKCKKTEVHSFLVEFCCLVGWLVCWVPAFVPTTLVRLSNQVSAETGSWVSSLFLV